jgi:hypothetical protein
LANANPAPPASDTGDLETILEVCHRSLRILTGVMIGAFVLIILCTTISTGPAVQVVGRGLYFVILLSAVASLVIWITRLRTERKMGRSSDVAAQVLKKL